MKPNFIYPPKIRLFVEQDLSAEGIAHLEKHQAHYVMNVMRHGEGDTLLLFNGRDGEWVAEIDSASKRHCQLKLREQAQAQVTVPDIWLLFAPVKKVRLDFLVQKATELGISAIQPVLTKRTDVARVKEDRMLSNMVEAAEQTGRLSVPDLLPTIKLEGLLKDWDPSRQLIFCDEGGEARAMAKALAKFEKGKPWAILIGPEGGFEDAERDLLRAQDFVHPVTLGPRILRADTAAISALTLWQSILGDWE